MSQQKLRQPMARAQQVRPHIFPAAQQIARRLFLVRRHVDGGQRTRPIEHRQLGCIAAVRLDPITGASRDQRRRNHLARNTCTVQRPLQFKPTRASLVAALDTPHPALHVLDEPKNRRAVRRQRL